MSLDKQDRIIHITMIAILMEAFYSFNYNTDVVENSELVLYTCLHVVKLGSETVSSYIEKNIHSRKITNGALVIDMKVEIIAVLRESSDAGCYNYLRFIVEKLARDRLRRNTGLAKPWKLITAGGCAKKIDGLLTIYLKCEEASGGDLDSLAKLMKTKYRELIRLKTQLHSIISKDYLNYNLNSKKIQNTDIQNILDGDMLEANVQLSKLYINYRAGEMPYSITNVLAE